MGYDGAECPAAAHGSPEGRRMTGYRAAKVSGLSPSTIYQACERGRLHHRWTWDAATGVERLEITQSELDLWLASPERLAGAAYALRDFGGG